MLNLNKENMTEPISPSGFRRYDPDPLTPTGFSTTKPGQSGQGYLELVAAISSHLQKRRPLKRARPVVCLDLYQAPDMDDFLARFRAAWEAAHGPAEWVDTRRALKDPHVLAQELQEFLTDDPIFGRVCDRQISLFFEPERWRALITTVGELLRAENETPVFITGPGALLSPLRLYSDVALYAAVPRETVFFASENGIGRNLGDDQDRGKWPRYKRSFYVDWPVQNRHLFAVLPACDYLIDMHDAANPAFVDTRLFFDGLAYAAQRPFRPRSIFMPGVWGGNRLQELVPGLPQDWPNCAWGFELVAPENTITLDYAGLPLRISFDLFMHFAASSILGPDNYRRFGDFFPIRFDFLDTMGGSNLSLQVHPPDAYINAYFGEPFAQDEMYYIMENRPGAQVYLGLTESTNREYFLADVARARSEQEPFEISKHVNSWEANPGDLFIIPAGTVHCSGADNLVLEISATPYIYTFKIYDYLRTDLDGQPRPISYERAFEVINFTRQTDWIRENLLSRAQCLAEGPGWRRWLLSASPLVFHSVERIDITSPFPDDTNDSGLHILCVVAGEGVRVVRDGERPGLDLSYAETGIVPGACGPYRLEPIGEAEVKVVKCFIQV